MKVWVEADYPFRRYLNEPGFDARVERAAGKHAHSSEAGPFEPNRRRKRGEPAYRATRRSVRTLAWLERGREAAAMARRLRRARLGLRVSLHADQLRDPKIRAAEEKALRERLRGPEGARLRRMLHEAEWRAGRVGQPRTGRG